MADVTVLIADLDAESAALDDLVGPLADWTLPTPAVGWTIAHQIAHLAWTDSVAVLAAVDPEAFQAEIEKALSDVGGFVDKAAAEGAAQPREDLLERWRIGRIELALALARVPDGTKLPWFGPPMSPASMITARLMETFAHGYDVADTLGVVPAATARLKNIAHIGVRTRDFAYILRDEPVPAAPFFVSLTAPDGSTWTWGPADATDTVTGPALDFCLLVTQRRNRADLGVKATGAADHWLDIAQAFAGRTRPRPAAGMIRIGNCSGFYGDRFSAMREMLTGGQLDVLTGDYLAELTMLILGRDRLKDPLLGYAKTFVRQLEDGLGLALEKGVKIVTNAGGLNPAGLAEAIDKLGTGAVVSYVEGDDLLARASDLGLGTPLTANAYLGAWGIAAALTAGADVVVTGRVTDASLVVGPAAAHHKWARDDWNALAGAVVAGHVVECGPQATGGNYSFFGRHDVRRPGFPIAEVYEDGSSVITKHDGTGGAVTVGTVTAQLLYEIGSARYAGPDVVARFDTISLSDDGPDRVKISGVVGEPPPPDVKVGLNTLGGFRNEMTFVLAGLDIEAKAELVKSQLVLPRPPAETTWTLARTDHADAAVEEEASALLRCVVRDPDPKVVGRPFSAAGIELALASYPGFHVTAPPGDASPYGVYSAAYVPADQVPHEVVLPDSRLAIRPPALTQPLADPPEPALPEPLSGPTRSAPLGTVAGARSGDKGGDANLGIWVHTEDEWRWLAHYLTVDEFERLLPECSGSTRRYVLPNLRALNFVVTGLLGQGVASQARFDPQAKALGEWLRSRLVDIPEVLL